MAWLRGRKGPAGGDGSLHRRRARGVLPGPRADRAHSLTPELGSGLPFRELGRAIRTITLLRYLSQPQLREQSTQSPTATRPFRGFAGWLMSDGNLTGHNDLDYQNKVVKFKELLANCVMYSAA